MLANQINTLLEIWAASLLELGSNPLFTNHMDLYYVIDSMSVGAVKWENFKITYKCKWDRQDELDEQDKVIELGGPGGQDGQDGQDEPEAPWMFDIYDYNATSDQRHWEDFMSGDWAWDEVAEQHWFPSSLAVTRPLFSVATRQMDYYPLYLSIGNVCNTARHAHCDAVVLIGFLAMPKMTREHANTQVFHKFKKQLFHSLLASVLQSLVYIADYEEQVLLLCIVCEWCLKCLTHWENLDKDALWHHHEHTELIIRELGPLTLWDEYGIDGDIVWVSNADIQILLDILHQLIKGGFKDHLVDWVERYLTHTHGRSATEKILDDIDQRIAAIALFTGLQCFPQGQHFKQWTGDDSKGLMKVYIAAIEGYVLQDVVCMFCAFLKFCYLDALAHFHSYREVFQNAQVVATFSLPWQHAMKHYPYLICQFSMLNGLCSLITETKHIKAVKWPYWCTNCFQALRLMLVINQRLDKFAVACADFEKCGMLRGTCLSHDCKDSADEPTASFEEDPGDMDDSPMSVEAHVLLAHTYSTELNIPQLLSILCCFLQSQLQQDDCDLEDVPLDECPFYDGCIHVYNSASLTFYASSDMSGLHSMCCKHICCSPMWRNEGPHYDCVFIVTNPHVEGMLGLDVARILCFFFSFKYPGTEHPCAIICWFDCIGDGPDTCTGMWIG
ncbi:hypothetical protein F5J12DRAFT_904943 [Pisolithus orientalis]|uniref:uncharacterized protein n=1 Tax=Pisolithus orientalis TaxID=936130 RepID=UPI0022259553|nr:uncharacterized protein F5J12DRAFT_904943 [Pisolithus orientalis]KAI6010848.1 hypothetical protein F5J12DRAFT_904943 [Pisolithus orientalis]